VERAGESRDPLTARVKGSGAASVKDLFDVTIGAMTSVDGFAKNFEPYTAPPELLKLLAFQKGVQTFEGYSKGFWLTEDDKGGLKSWSEDPEFLARLLPFAQADGKGSFYALWAQGTSENASTFPVLVFGGEGGANVVAEDVKGLLGIIAFDAEPSVDAGGIFFDRDDPSHAERHADYVAWLAELGVEPAEDPQTLIDAAQARHGTAFNAWLAQYYIDNG
jgi:hypothetical protein